MAKDDKKDPRDVPRGDGLWDQAVRASDAHKERTRESTRAGRGSKADTTGDKSESKQQKGDKSAEQGEDKVSDDGTRTMWERITGKDRK